MREGCSSREGRRSKEIRKEVGENGELHACQPAAEDMALPREVVFWSTGLKWHRPTPAVNPYIPSLFPSE